MNLLGCLAVPRYLVSRSKVLLRRRKAATRSRPISKKKLKEEAKIYNYAHEYKLLQIQKELDKRLSPTQHINELMDDIFYPDVTAAHEEAARLQIQASTLTQLADVEESDPLLTEISNKVLATDLISLYLESRDQIKTQHIEAVIERLGTYFRRRERIKQEAERRWARTAQHMKKKNKDYKETKCPYLFIDRADTLTYKPWNQMIEDINAKIEETLMTEQSQEFVQAMHGFAQLIQNIFQAINYLPHSTYDIFKKYYVYLSQEEVSSMFVAQAESLIKAAGLKHAVRLPIYNIVTTTQNTEADIFDNITQMLLLHVLATPETAPPQLVVCAKMLYYNTRLLNDLILDGIKEQTLRNVAELEFEKTHMIFSLFVVRIRPPDADFIQMLKFDLLRKAPNATSKTVLFYCLSHFKAGCLVDAQLTPHLDLQGLDLVHQVCEAICSKYCGSGALIYKQVQELVDAFFSNRVTDANLLELVTNELTRRRQEFTLEELGLLGFKIWQLGYHSPVMARIIAEEFIVRYSSTRKRYQEQQVPALGSGNLEDLQGQFQLEGDYYRLTQLEESLVIALYMLFSSVEGKPQTLSPLLDKLFPVYPLSLSSRHPLAYELVSNLNEFTKLHKILWYIKAIPPAAVPAPSSLDTFYHGSAGSPVDKAMRREAEESGKFLKNFNPGTGTFVREAWSKFRLQDSQAYLAYINIGLEAKNYFNGQKSASQQLIQLRNEAVSEQKSRKSIAQQQKSATKDSKGRIYLLD